MPWRVRPRSVSSLCPSHLNFDSRQCPGPTPAALSPPSEPRSGHFKHLPQTSRGAANGTSKNHVPAMCSGEYSRNRNSQRRALAHAWPSKGPHRIIPYQHSKNRLNKPKIIFILDNLTLICTRKNLAFGRSKRAPGSRFVHSFILVKLNHFFVDSNASKAYLHPLIYFRIFDPTGLFFMNVNVIFVILVSPNCFLPRSPFYLC